MEEQVQGSEQPVEKQEIIMIEDLAHINEEKGVPDPENSEILIDNILRNIANAAKTYAYMYNVESGIGLPNKIKDNNYEVSDIFRLDKDINPCRWLDDTNYVRYTITFKDEVTTYGARFSELDKGRGVVYQSDDDFINVIGGCALNILINLGADIHEYPMAESKKIVNSILLKIKSAIQHELNHAYQEANKRNMIPKYPKDLSNNSIIDVTDFNIGYYDVTSRINNSSSNLDNDEKSFLTLLYTSCYIEVNANVSGFYRSMVNDLDTIGHLRNISDYGEYKIYNGNLSFINKFKNNDLLKRYYADVRFMFGETTASGIHMFKKHIHSRNKNVLSKMKNLYEYVDKIGRIKPKYKESDLKEAHQNYIDKIINEHMPKGSIIDESKREVYSCYINNYYVSDPESILNRINCLFKNVC